MLQEFKPVRRHKAQVGRVSGHVRVGKDYQSMLERDFLRLLQFDPRVEDFIVQPLAIEFLHGGELHRYVPDVLVTYLDDSSGKPHRPELVEVLSSELYPKEGSVELEGYRQASLRCKERGWIFLTVTEKEIQTQRLENVDFLFSNKGRQVNPQKAEPIFQALEALQGLATVEAVLEKLCSTKVERAHWNRELWTLVANRDLYMDLDEPISTASLISLGGNHVTRR